MPAVLATPSIAATRVLSAAVAALLALAVVVLGVKIGAGGFGLGERAPSSATAVPAAALVDLQRSLPAGFDLQQTLLSLLPPVTDQPATPVAPTLLESAPAAIVADPVAPTPTPAPTPAPAPAPGPSNGVVPPSPVPVPAPVPDPQPIVNPIVQPVVDPVQQLVDAVTGTLGL